MHHTSHYLFYLLGPPSTPHYHTPLPYLGLPGTTSHALSDFAENFYNSTLPYLPPSPSRGPRASCLQVADKTTRRALHTTPDAAFAFACLPLLLPEHAMRLRGCSHRTEGETPLADTAALAALQHVSGSPEARRARLPAPLPTATTQNGSALPHKTYATWEVSPRNATLRCHAYPPPSAAPLCGPLPPTLAAPVPTTPCRLEGKQGAGQKTSTGAALCYTHVRSLQFRRTHHA